jgi:hypothetical protein
MITDSRRLRRPFLVLALSAALAGAQAGGPRAFRVVAFFTGKEDPAHVSFVREANQWFAAAARVNGFRYEATTDWSRLEPSLLSRCQVVVFLDTRPETPAQRTAFREYVEKGGAWLGFHFAAFALTPSAYPQDWDWYHDEFLGAGSYRGNTWRPTSAILRVESPRHPALHGLPTTFRSAPNEWYSWERDLRLNPAIEVLLAIDPSSFPLGTGPKPNEIWHEGYYPVVWTNRHYRMAYVNMGHNDIDYEGGSHRELSSTFANEVQDRLILQLLFWLARREMEPSAR